MTVATDACITHSAERHRSALSNNRGYARHAPLGAGGRDDTAPISRMWRLPRLGPPLD